MIKTANLISYLPHILQNIRELQAITDAENPEFNLLFDTSEKVLANLFIYDADVDGIARYEKMLGIKPSIDDTLESRIFRVIARWNVRVPYTWNSFLSKLDVLCGEGNYNIVLRNDDYSIDLTIHIGVYGGLIEIHRLLDKIMPCNMILNAVNILYSQKQTSVYFGSAITCGSYYKLTTNLNTEYDVSSEVKVGSKLIDGARYHLTSNISNNYQVTSDVKAGSKIIDGAIYEIKTTE